MKRFMLVLAAAALLASPMTSSAEITWTDIGGDISLMYFWSDNVQDFDDDDGSVFGDDDGDFVRTELHLNFKADLDDDITVGVSLEVDRDLGSIDEATGGNGFDGIGEGDLAVFLEEGYITIVEPFDLPITVTGGRFFANFGDDSTADDYNGYWGDSFIIGDGNAGSPGTLNALGDWETDPFDGAVITADYDTFVVNLLWLLATDINSAGDRGDDTELIGFYTNYLGIEGMQIDGYFTWVNSDGLTVAGAAGLADLVGNTNQFTVGARWAGACMDDTVAYKLEGAYQFGDQDDAAGVGGGDDGDIDAWAVEAGVNWHPDHDLNPEIGFIYAHMSGDDDIDEDAEAFTAAFENKGYGLIADAFVYTNMNVFNLYAGIDINEDLRLNLDGYYYIIDEEDSPIANLGGDAFIGGVAPDDDELGWEIDAQLDYTYSENLDAFVGAGVFISEDAVEDALGTDDEAFFVRTGVKVAF